MLAVGLGLAMGIAGQVNLAQVAFFGVGAYTTAILTIHRPRLLGRAAGEHRRRRAARARRRHSGPAGAVALPRHRHARPGARRSPTGAHQLVDRRRRRGLPGIPVPDARPASTCPASTSTTTSNWSCSRPCSLRPVVVRTALGRRCGRCATTPSPPAPSASRCRCYRMTAFLLAGVYGGVAGVLYAADPLRRPETFSIANMFLLLAMVIIGGRQACSAAALGAALLIYVCASASSDFAPTRRSATARRRAHGGVRADRPGGLSRQRLAIASGELPRACRRGDARRGGGRRARRRCGPSPAVAAGRGRRASSRACVLEIAAVTKQFRGLMALDDVSLDVEAARSTASSARTAPARPPCSTWSRALRPTAGRVELARRRVISAARLPRRPGRRRPGPSRTCACSAR